MVTTTMMLSTSKQLEEASTVESAASTSNPNQSAANLNLNHIMSSPSSASSSSSVDDASTENSKTNTNGTSSLSPPHPAPTPPLSNSDVSADPDHLLAAKFLSIYDYWKNFDIKKLQDDLNDQIECVHKTQEEFNELGNKFSELSREIRMLVSEDVQKTVSPLLKLFQSEIDALARRCKSTETTCVDLFKLLTNVPDPFPVIESVKTNKSEIQLSKKILKLQNENKQLRENMPNKNKMTPDKELILKLTENVTKTSSLNLELRSKLKISEGEIESYKKLLSDYQNELFELKNKHINEIKSEILKENDKLKKQHDSQSSLQSQNLHNLAENNSNSNKNDKLTNLEMLKKSTSNDTLKSTLTNGSRSKSDTPGSPNGDNSLKLLLDTKCLSSSPPPPSSSSSSTSSYSSSVSPSSTTVTPNKSSGDYSALKSNYFRSNPASESTAASDVDSSPTGEYLNTSDIAARVRDLLSVHNIGQRVFAKYILGLSQGTVSELLSKPKHWSKLTEKGRESYRKMNAWASSDESIGSLKALGPRKGNKDSYFYQNGTGASLLKDESGSSTDQRIAAILDEAKRQMRAQGKLESTYSAASSPSRSSSRHSSQSALDDSPLAMSPSSHQQLGAHVKREYISDDENNDMEEDLRDQGHQYGAFPLDLTVKSKQVMMSMGGENANPKKRKLDYSTTSDNENESSSSIAAAAAAAVEQLRRGQFTSGRSALTSIDQLKMMTSPSGSIQSSAASPFGGVHSGSSKPLKCILPPVSQEQFDKYSNINTEELVKKVKDLLSKFSISQRLFGECILGLSQGSVSDLLARPKHWVMLTQKGREPFIRMQMFIDDPDSIKKLMSNQYKGGGMISSSSDNKTLVQPRASSLSSIFQSNSGLLQIDSKDVNNNHVGVKHHQKSAHSSPSDANTNSSHDITEHTTSSTLASILTSMAPTTKSGSSSSSVTATIIPYDISSLSSLSSDLNTEEITNRVKESLLNNNIGQKLFGEAVLNLSQGTVSELLSKPKPWQTLSIKGREPYLRMYMWLSDPLKLEKINEWKEERSAIKQRVAAAAAAASSVMAANEAANGDGGSEQKPKRRFIFSEEQKEQLMRAFKYDPYPAVNQMEQLAARLGLQTRTVINWFHNHRMRIRYKSNSAALAASNHGANSPPELNPFLNGPPLSGRLSRGNHASRSSQFLSSQSQQQFGLGTNDSSSVYNEDETLVSTSNYEDEGEQGQAGQSYNDDEDMMNGTGGEMMDEENYEEASDNEEETSAEINSLYINNSNNNQHDDEDEINDEDDDDDKYSDNSGHNNSNPASSYLQQVAQQHMNSSKRRKPHNPQKLNYGAAVAAAAVVQALAAAASAYKHHQQQQQQQDD